MKAYKNPVYQEMLVQIYKKYLKFSNYSGIIQIQDK